jgi:glycosyltransferase involved in cell wall biosynthesis
VHALTTVLTVHNYYREPGGEDQLFVTESALIEQHGHRVIRYEDHNDRIQSGLLTGITATWNQRSYNRIHALVESHNPDVAHFHNTFPLISPAAYYAVRRLGVPVVQLLSNYRLLCPGGLFLRNNETCEKCVHQRSFRPALAHGCYRGSHAATAAVVGMVNSHWTLGTWTRQVDVYITLSEFARNKFIAGGLSGDRIVVKRNFVAPDPGIGDGAGKYVLFAGRLSEEKGIRTLAAAWHRLPRIPLVVAGEGPLAGISWPAGVTCLGHVSRQEIFARMKDASALIFPSICYENAPLTILEAFSCGLPVIASDLGSIPELVTHGRTGLLFRAGDAEDLARQVEFAFKDPARLREMRDAARREYLTKYTAERNYDALLQIYAMAKEEAGRHALMQRLVSDEA